MIQSFFSTDPGPDLLQRILLCIAGGMALGCFHFGGLWVTLQKICKTKFYGLILIASFLLRSLATLTGIFVLGNGEWLGTTACIGGVLIMRKFFILGIKSPVVSQVKGSPT